MSYYFIHSLVRDTSDGVTLARIATLTTGDSPVILLARVANQANHVWQARALSRSMIARSSWTIGTKDVTLTVPAVLLQGVTVETWLTDLTIGPVRIKETLQAATGVWVAVAWFVDVCVVAAVARSAASSDFFWIAIVILSATLATWARVTLETVAEDIVCNRIEGAALSVGMARVQCSWNTIVVHCVKIK